MEDAITDIQGIKSYRLYNFVSFTGDHTDITDAQFFPAQSTYPCYQSVNPSNFYVNLCQGFYFIADTTNYGAGQYTDFGDEG
jgi:hypothetical protein